MEKLYWKTRKRIINMIFQIKAYVHKRRDFLEKVKKDVALEKRIFRNVIKVFIKNIFYIGLIIFIEHKIINSGLVFDMIQKYLTFDFFESKNLITTMNSSVEKNIDVFIGILTAMVGIVGVFLGLYCANVMSLFSQKYVNTPKKISVLFENDLITNKSIQDITDYLLFTILVLFFLIFGIDFGILMIFICVIKSFKIIVSFGFTSRRTYQFSDIYFVTNYIYGDMNKIFKQLKKGKLFINDANFQNHYKKQMKTLLHTLNEVNNYVLEKEEIASASLENFVLENMVMLKIYWEDKAKISYKSYWFDEKIKYKKWYFASDHEITMALNTGTLLKYETEKNYYWFEEEIAKINFNCFDYLVKRKLFSAIYNIVQNIELLSANSVSSGTAHFFVKNLYLVQTKVQEIVKKSLFTEEELMGLVEAIIMNYLALIIETRKYYKNIKINTVIPNINDFERKDWLTPNRFSNFEDIKKLHDCVVAEMEIEGKRITPEWYINQMFIKHYYDDLLIVYQLLDNIVNKYIPEFSKTLFDDEKFGSSMIIYAKYSEIISKIHELNDHLKNEIDKCLEFHKEKEILWKEKPDYDIVEKISKKYVNMMPEWCKSTSVFFVNHKEDIDKYPDLLGACLIYLSELLFEAIIENDYESFSLNYGNLLGVSLLYQSFSRNDLLEIKETHMQLPALVALVNPIINYCELSGYAYLNGELRSDERWKELVINDTKEKIKNKKHIKDSLDVMKLKNMAIYNNDILRTNWKMKMKQALIDSDLIKWKQDKFYEVYDGESKLINAVLGVKDRIDLFRCEGYEIYAITVLNSYLGEEEKYSSVSNWEQRYYGKEKND